MEFLPPGCEERSRRQQERGHVVAEGVRVDDYIVRKITIANVPTEQLAQYILRRRCAELSVERSSSEGNIQERMGIVHHAPLILPPQYLG